MTASGCELERLQIGSGSQNQDENSLDNSPLGIENGFHRIGSVWEVLESYAWPLVNYATALTGLREGLEARLQRIMRTHDLDDSEISQQDRNNFRVVADNFHPWLHSHFLTASVDALRRIAEEYAEDEPSIPDIISRLKMFSEVLEDELRRRVFLFVVPEDVNLYRDPIASFVHT